MATVHVDVTSDASDLTSDLKKVDRAMEDVEDQAKDTGRGLGRLGDGADEAERRTMGLRDMIDGTAAVMAGPGEQGISAYLQGWADMASGMVNFIVPTLQNLSKQILITAKNAIVGAAQHVASTAKMVASWVVLGVQSLIHAAKVAAAWLIAMGPIALVIAAVVGLVAVIVLNWDKIKGWIKAGWEFVKKVTKAFIDFMVNLFLNWTFPGLIIKHWDKIKEGAQAVWDFIKNTFGGIVDFFKGIPEAIGRAFNGLKLIITGPFIAGFRAIAQAWNSTVGKLSFKAPSWIPGIGGKGWDVPDIPVPSFHSGGTFRAPRAGGEGLALLRDGEVVTTPTQTARTVSGGATVYNFTVNGFVGSEMQLAQELDRLLTRRSRVAGLGFA